MIQWRDACYSVFETTDNFMPVLVNRKLQLMIDPSKINVKKEELLPLDPVPNDHYIIWNNDTMQMAVTTAFLHNEGERNFMQLIKGKDMRWEFDD